MGFLSRLFGSAGVPVASLEDRRREQLERFARLSSELADLYARDGPGHPVPMHRRRSAEARQLLAEGYDEEQVRALTIGIRKPPEIDWSNAKAVDYGVPQYGWRTKIRPLEDQLHDVALQLRANVEDWQTATSDIYKIGSAAADLRAIDPAVEERSMEAARRMGPWSEGSTGKAVVYADGVVVTSQDDASGNPLFEHVKDANQRRSPVALLTINADGSCEVQHNLRHENWLASKLQAHDAKLHLQAPHP